MKPKPIPLRITISLSFLMLIQSLTTSCYSQDYSKLIIGDWKLVTINFYFRGEETTYNLNGASYTTDDNEDELLKYTNKGPVTYTFNKYNELVIKDRNGSFMSKIISYRFEGNKLYLGSQETPIELLTKTKLKFIEGWTTFDISSKSTGGKLAYSYVLTKM
jgi:hypothetical protein